MKRVISKTRAMQIYRVMVEYQFKNDFSMTTREIADVVGLRSNSDISAHVRWLEANGYVKSKGKQYRAVPYEEVKGDVT